MMRMRASPQVALPFQPFAISLRLVVGDRQMWLLARLDGMLRARRNLFAAVFLLLLKLFVVGNVT